ncbi:hypothetical protein [Sphingopyxis sp. RIFCSPHIGHO2_12_FULL_65_19]|uniref:hypothetical protein n=1 Tax=Sphingopyxis sp. RIFCSPHIGHO2_12_FULL_65_19 TaxID=1802172 RepID=UPI0025E30ABC|nr:hypothetical protein [Sphingopyxis sp. RIFCSPHIGHO2_12_FULL_65_19]
MTASPFAMKLAAFHEAKTAFARHKEACEPAQGASDDDQRAYEGSYAPLVSAMTDAGLAVVKCPAASFHDLAEKIEIFRGEDMHEYEDVADLLDFIVDDARLLTGVEP